MMSQLSPEMVRKNPWDPSEKVREIRLEEFMEKVSFESRVEEESNEKWQ